MYKLAFTAWAISIAAFIYMWVMHVSEPWALSIAIPIIIMLLSLMVFRKSSGVIKKIHYFVVIPGLLVTLVADSYLLIQGGQSAIGAFFWSFAAGVAYLGFMAVLSIIYVVINGRDKFSTNQVNSTDVNKKQRS